MASRSTQSAENAGSPSYLVPFIIVTALFGIFGFLTNLNSNSVDQAGRDLSA